MSLLAVTADGAAARTRIKFCGMTRREDVAVAVDLGATYVGAIFAGGPRQRSIEQARQLFSGIVGVQSTADRAAGGDHASISAT